MGKCSATFRKSQILVFHACLKVGDKILGFDLSHGGHLTHGSPVNFSGRLYNPVFYGVDKETGMLNYGKFKRLH